MILGNVSLLKLIKKRPLTNSADGFDYTEHQKYYFRSLTVVPIVFEIFRNTTNATNATNTTNATT